MEGTVAAQEVGEIGTGFAEIRTGLGELEASHRALLEHLPGIAVAVIDLDRRFTYVSKSLEGFGWQRDEIVDKELRDVVPPGAPLIALYESALTGERQSSDHHSLRGDRRFSLEVVPLRTPAGEIVGAMAIGQDVTARDETTRRLQEALGEFETAFQYNAIGMALTDLDGRWLRVNKRVCELVGYEEEELLALDFQAITHPADLDENLAVRTRLLAGELDAYQMEKRYIRKDGSIVPVLISVSVVRDEDGGAVRCVSQIEDRTNEIRRRELETELAERRRADSLNVLAGGIAHDFNNLLVGILGHTSMALGEVAVGSPARRHLEQVELSARAVATLTEQMLAFSGKTWRELVDVDLGGHARELHERLSASLAGVDVQLSLSPGVPNVRADLGQLRQITANLADNAFEALGSDGGTVSLATGSVHLTRNALDAYAVGLHATPGLFAYLDIADDGAGMSEDVCKRMFEPFFTTKFQGRGLGLAAVDGLVRGHGGAIAVQSAPGAGTRVRLLLPAAA